MVKALDELTTLQQDMKQSTEQWKEIVKKQLVSEMTRFEAQIKAASIVSHLISFRMSHQAVGRCCPSMQRLASADAAR